MRTLLLTGWLLICCVCLHAQEEVVDTVITDTEYPEPAPVSQQWERNELEIPADSIKAAKQAPDLVYLQQFDSLLKAVRAQQSALSKQPAPEQGPSWLERVFAAQITVYLFWALALFFVGYILYRLFIAGLFRRSPGKRTLAPEEIPGGTPEEQDWNQLAQTHAAGGDYRMAVRCMYMHTLHALNDRGSIRFTADKTNARYLAELKDTPYRDPASELFRYYEYSWYGGFITDALIYRKVRSLVQQILQEQ